MRLRPGALWRYRPRVLTLVVVAFITPPVVLANFTSEIISQPDPGVYKGVYGWPLFWHWHDMIATPGPTGVFGWDYSAIRLAGNLALWFFMLAGPAGVCEWLLRRSRPGLRWSLRSMLLAVALTAAFFGWLAAARNRASVQDPIITWLEENLQTVYVERAPPKWLEFIIPDRYRRRVIGVEMQMFDGKTLDVQFIQQLAQLPRLQHLEINVEHRTRPMVAALSSMRCLRSLRIDEYAIEEDEHISQEFLAAIGTLTELERLSLEDVTVTRKSLALLSGLTNLRSLWLQGFNDDEDLFAYLPALPRLEAIDFGYARLSNQSLRRLSAFPKLRALNLSMAELSPDADLAALGALESLEEVAIDARMLSTVGADSIAAMKHVKVLHISDNHFYDELQTTTRVLDRGEVSVLEREAGHARQSLEALRQANPRMRTDTNCLFMLSNNTLIPRGLEQGKYTSSWLPAYIGWFSPSTCNQLRSQMTTSARKKAQQNQSTTAE